MNQDRPPTQRGEGGQFYASPPGVVVSIPSPRLLVSRQARRLRQDRAENAGGLPSLSSLTFTPPYAIHFFAGRWWALDSQACAVLDRIGSAGHERRPGPKVVATPTRNRR